MKNKSAPPWANTAARGRSTTASTGVLTPTDLSAQQQLPADGVHLAHIWRGPRDRSRAIQFALREYGGHQFLDVRQYVASSGIMVPTSRGVTLEVRQLGKFAAAAGRAYREAVRLGLATEMSS